MIIGGILIIFVLIICIIISTGSFAWGYWLAGYEEIARWIIVFGIFWLAAQWRKWRWFSAMAVFIALFLAAFGVWFEFVPGWMFNGATFGVLAWNLADFQQKMKLLPSREDKIGMTRRHLIRVGFLAVGSILITLALGISR